MKSSRTDDLESRIIRDFLDILILKYLRNHPNSSGYKIMRHLVDTYDTPFSPGTIYSAIYWLKQQQLVCGSNCTGGGMYNLTIEGEKKLKDTAQLSPKIQKLVSEILLIQC